MQLNAVRSISVGDKRSNISIDIGWWRPVSRRAIVHAIDSVISAVVAVSQPATSSVIFHRKYSTVNFSSSERKWRQPTTSDVAFTFSTNAITRANTWRRCIHNPFEAFCMRVYTHGIGSYVYTAFIPPDATATWKTEAASFFSRPKRTFHDHGSNVIAFRPMNAR